MTSTTMKQLVLTSAITVFALAAQSNAADAWTNCPEPGPNQVVVYQLAWFQGSCQTLNLRADRVPTGFTGVEGEGNFSFSPVRYTWDTLFARNSISSVKVGTGVYLTLFSDPYFAGGHIDFNPLVPGLVPGYYYWVGGIDKQTDSLRITPIERDCRKRADGTFRALQTGQVAIYENDSYGGDCVQWSASDPIYPGGLLGQVDMGTTGLFKLFSASSIRVGVNTVVRLCRSWGIYTFQAHPYYCESFNGDVWRLANTAFGSDQLGSLKVVSTQPPR